MRETTRAEEPPSSSGGGKGVTPVGHAADSPDSSFLHEAGQVAVRLLRALGEVAEGWLRASKDAPLPRWLATIVLATVVATVYLNVAPKSEWSARFEWIVGAADFVAVMVMVVAATAIVVLDCIQEVHRRAVMTRRALGNHGGRSKR
jgi:sterol desaturase/sphingolipid hydroxylase (fatty acid hydroxylase superfamily)